MSKEEQPEILEQARQLLEVIQEQLQCPSRNTTMTSYRRDGSVIISSDIRQRVSEWLKANPQNNPVPHTTQITWSHDPTSIVVTRRGEDSHETFLHMKKHKTRAMPDCSITSHVQAPLPPCPFCGSLEEEKTKHQIVRYNDLAFALVCWNCHAHGPATVDEKLVREKWSRREKVWNER